MKTTFKEKKRLYCECGASARDTGKERGRFRRRHPVDADAAHVAEQRRMKAKTKEVESSAQEN